MLYKSDVGVWSLAHRSVATYPKEIFLENFHKEDPTLTEYCKLVAHYGSDKYTAPELMKEALGGFQLLDLIITGLKSHMTC